MVLLCTREMSKKIKKIKLRIIGHMAQVCKQGRITFAMLIFIFDVWRVGERCSEMGKMPREFAIKILLIKCLSRHLKAEVVLGLSQTFSAQGSGFRSVLPLSLYIYHQDS